MKQMQKSWTPKRKEKARFILQRERVAERVPVHVPPAVEPENHDFDVSGISSVKPESCCGLGLLEIPRYSEEQEYAVDIQS